MGLQLNIDDAFPFLRNMVLESVVHQPLPLNRSGKPGRMRAILRMEADAAAFHAE